MLIFLAVFMRFMYVSMAQFPPSPPPFSWKTIPLFIHAANQSGPLNQTAAEYMSTFSLATIEKIQDLNSSCSQNTPAPCEEDKIIAALTQIRSFNQATRNLFYLNTIINFPQYRLSTKFYGENEKYLLHDEAGKLVYLGECQPNSPNFTLFDLSYNETRNFWLETVQYALNNKAGVVDGIFADRGKPTFQISHCLNLTQNQSNALNNGHILLMQETMELIKKLNPNRYVMIANGNDIPKVNGRMFESINTMQYLSEFMNETGVRITEAHQDECTIYSKVYNQSLAVYLISAFEGSYYGCTEQWTLQTGWDTIWENPDYHKPLGEPLMNATFNNQTDTYYREFKQGVKVWLDYNLSAPCIKGLGPLALHKKRNLCEYLYTHFCSRNIRLF